MHDSFFDTPFVGLYHHVSPQPSKAYLDPFYEKLNQPRTDEERAEGYRESARRRRDLCERTIAELDQAESYASKEQRAAISAARATIRTHLADSVRTLGDEETAYKMLKTALIEAQESGEDEAHFRTLNSLGTFLSLGGDYNGAAYWFMRSMMYAHAHWPYNLDMTLDWLATCLENLERFPEARFLRDWHCILWPWNIGLQVANFESRLKAGFRDRVVVTARLKPEHSCKQAANVLAARRALGWKKRARKAAEVGFSLAEESGDRHWILAFGDELGMDTMQMMREWGSKSGRAE